MGKSKGAKQQVTDYYMSLHYGVCSGPVDALLGLTVKEKPAWSGELTSQTSFGLNLPELFGGAKKEGGLAGTEHFLPGAPTQTLPTALALRFGLTEATCPGFRGLTSLFFVGGGIGSTGNPWLDLTVNGGNYRGFKWGSNNPYLPGVWATVRRILTRSDGTLQWYSERAAVNSGERTPRAICFALDRSTSMAGERLATMKAAMDTVLDLIGASASSGVQIDLSVVTFGDPAQTITRRSVDAGDVDDVNAFVQSRTAGANDTDFRAGMNAAKTFFDGTDAGITDRFLFFITDGEPTDSGGDSAATVAGVAAATLATMPNVDSYGINIILENTTYTAMVDNTPSDGVPVVSGSDPAGLRNAVLNALFPDSVIADMNPAHIIRECLVDTDFGMGAPPASIDEASFIAAADTLYAEGFGLSMLWTRQASIESFVTEILDHIQAMLYVNPRTGLLTLKLIRDDYDPESLRIITPDEAKMSSFQRKAWGETIGEIVVTWTNPENEQEETVTVQDLANIAIQGGIVSDSRNYYGVRNSTLAARLATRDLRTSSQPLASCEIEIDRSGWDLLPGDCIKLVWPDHGLNEVIFRVNRVDYGKTGNGKVRASLLEDIFSLSVDAYVLPPSTEWQDTSSEPEPIEHVRIVTLPAFMAVAAGESDLGYPEVIAGVLASSDNNDIQSYELVSEEVLPNGTAEWENVGTRQLVGRAELSEPLIAEAETETDAFTGLAGGPGPTVGGFVFIGDDDEDVVEIAMIDSYDEDTGEWTLARGVLDTVPRAWPVDTPVWFVDQYSDFEDTTIRSAGEEVEYRLQSRTSLGLLPFASTPSVFETLTERPHLPNRPADVTAYGEAWSSETSVIDAVARPDPWVTVTWATRNRTMEDTVVVRWGEAPVTPEDGQTTVIEVLDLSGTLLATHDALTGGTFDVPNSSFGSEPVVRLRVSSERDDLRSLQYFEHWVQVGPLSFDSTIITFDRTAFTMDQA